MNEITLREYVDTRIDSLEKATIIASSQLEKRLEGMNEFRAQLKDQSATYFTRAEHEQFLRRVEDDIRVLRESKALLEGKASQMSVNIALLISGIGLILTVLNIAKLII